MAEGRPKILLIDDEPDIVLTVGKRLEVAGFDVMAAQDGAEGFEKARAQRPDIIIVDLMMPKRSGVKVSTAFKEDASFCDIPIILYSSMWDERNERLLRDSRADTHVTKIQGSGVLIDAINALLEKSRRPV